MSDRLPTTKYGTTLSVPWRQFVDGKGWVGDMSFGPGGAIVVVVIDVNWADLDTAVVELLGKAEKSGTSIARTLPMRHPRWPNLTCTRITGVEGVGWKEKVVNAAGAYSDYEIARLTCAFEQRRYKILSDANVGPNEWKRWVQYKGKDTVEMLQRDKGNMVWEEGPGSLTAPPQDFEGPQGQLLANSRLLWVWNEVPADGLFNADGRPLNIQNGLGKINDATFAGYPAGTLFFEAADYDEEPMPIDFNGEWKTGGYPTYYKASLSFIFKDPPIEAGYTARGWNLDPYPLDGLWYLTKYKPSTTGEPLRRKHESYDFNKLFQMN